MPEIRVNSAGSRKSAVVGSIIHDDSESWKDKWFITLDIDWAHDDILGYAIDMVEEAGICATWLVTHETRWLERLASNPLFELGLHPNFNELLNGNVDAERLSAAKITEDLLSLVPEARVVRSHSLAYSSRLSDIFVEFGITHDLNSYIPRDATTAIGPWKLPNGQTRIPTGWEDDLEFPIRFLPDWSTWVGIRVLNFHPIHLFLNSESSGRYESTREFHKYPEDLVQHRNEALGVQSIFRSLASFLEE